MALTLAITNRLQATMESNLQRAVKERFASRLAAKDFTLWGHEAEPEAKKRLGWIDSPTRFLPLVAEVESVRTELLSKGMKTVVVCGMGGSSLGPWVMTRESPTPLLILDSTHPDVINPVIHGDLSSTVVVVSSKSGTTIETDSHRRLVEKAFIDQKLDPAEHLIVVTDPGTELHEMAGNKGYTYFLGDPDIGGRYSALSPFGLVPAGLAGVDVRAFIHEADAIAPLLFSDDPSNPALQLGSAIASSHPSVNKLLLRSSKKHPGLVDWVEQLVAESTGKQGRGLLPVVDSGLDQIPDGIVVAEKPEADVVVDGTLPELFLLWQVATAYACSLIGVNPFDQPNVEGAKEAAKRLLAEPAAEHSEGAPVEGGHCWVSPGISVNSSNVRDIIDHLISHMSPGSYLAVMLYAPEDQALTAKLQKSLESATGRPVTLGFGPRFLHSTGQLHKGGRKEGVFLSLVRKPTVELPIPGREFDACTLVLAQARGDRDVLIETGQPVVSCELDAQNFDELLSDLAGL